MRCLIRSTISFDACSPVEPKSLNVKAISIKQPFAGLIAYGKKTLEIRTWATKYRGPLLICASKTIYPGNVYLPGRPGEPGTVMSAKEYWHKLFALNETDFDPFRITVGVCTVNLVDVRPMVKEDEANARHPFIEGAFVWVFENPMRINPVPVTGKLGIFEANLSSIEYLAPVH